MVVTVTIIQSSPVILQPRPPCPPPYPISSPPPQRSQPTLSSTRVIQAVRRTEARARRAEQFTGAPYRYSLSAAAGFSDLPVRRLRKLCRDGEIQAVKLAGWWFVHRDEFMRLPDPASTMQWQSNRDRQQIFLRLFQYLAAMLHPCEAACIIQVLLKDLCRAVQARREAQIMKTPKASLGTAPSGVSVMGLSIRHRRRMPRGC